jgi:hypothetical protein
LALKPKCEKENRLQRSSLLSLERRRFAKLFARFKVLGKHGNNYFPFQASKAKADGQSRPQKNLAAVPPKKSNFSQPSISFPKSVNSDEARHKAPAALKGAREKEVEEWEEVPLEQEEEKELEAGKTETEGEEELSMEEEEEERAVVETEKMTFRGVEIDVEKCPTGVEPTLAKANTIMAAWKQKVGHDIYNGKEYRWNLHTAITTHTRIIMVRITTNRT